MIPLLKDPVVIELEAICSRMAIPTKFLHANLFEANFGLDTLEAVEFPVLVHVSTTKNKNEFEVSGEVIRTATVVCLLLDRAPNKTTDDFKSYDLNEKMNQMRLLADNLMYWVNRSAISVYGGVDNWQSDNVFKQFDAHLFGQAIQFDWRMSTGTNGYYNTPITQEQ